MVRLGQKIWQHPVNLLQRYLWDGLSHHIIILLKSRYWLVGEIISLVVVSERGVPALVLVVVSAFQAVEKVFLGPVILYLRESLVSCAVSLGKSGFQGFGS